MAKSAGVMRTIDCMESEAFLDHNLRSPSEPRGYGTVDAQLVHEWWVRDWRMCMTWGVVEK